MDDLSDIHLEDLISLKSHIYQEIDKRQNIWELQFFDLLNLYPEDKSKYNIDLTRVGVYKPGNTCSRYCLTLKHYDIFSIMKYYGGYTIKYFKQEEDYPKFVSFKNKQDVLNFMINKNFTDNVIKIIDFYLDVCIVDHVGDLIKI